MYLENLIKILMITIMQFSIIIKLDLKALKIKLNFNIFLNSSTVKLSYSLEHIINSDILSKDKFQISLM